MARLRRRLTDTNTQDPRFRRRLEAFARLVKHSPRQPRDTGWYWGLVRHVGTDEADRLVADAPDRDDWHP